MVICAEALLPLAITAIVTTGGPHNSSHAKWGEKHPRNDQEPGLKRGREGRQTRNIVSRDVRGGGGGGYSCKS